MERFMIELTYVAISLAIGLFVTFVFYVVGSPFVRPALYLAAQLVEDRGGESLMTAYTIINTTISAIFATQCFAQYFSSAINR